MVVSLDVLVCNANAAELGICAGLESLNLTDRSSELGGHGQGQSLGTWGGRSTESNLLVPDTNCAALSWGVGGHVA